MARFFSEQEIDGFRDCFYLNCKEGIIDDVDQLKFVMRSVGFSPTVGELKRYLEQKNCAHAHMQVEKIPDEILKAFEVSPFIKKNNVQTDTLRHLLCNCGEKLTHKEFNSLLRDLAIQKPEVSYKQFVKSLVIQRIDGGN